MFQEDRTLSLSEIGGKILTLCVDAFVSHEIVSEYERRTHPENYPVCRVLYWRFPFRSYCETAKP